MLEWGRSIDRHTGDGGEITRCHGSCPAFLPFENCTPTLSLSEDSSRSLSNRNIFPSRGLLNGVQLDVTRGLETGAKSSCCPAFRGEPYALTNPKHD